MFIQECQECPRDECRRKGREGKGGEAAEGGLKPNAVLMTSAKPRRSPRWR